MSSQGLWMLIVTVLTIWSGCSSSKPASRAEATTHPVRRVGYYESRAIAVAFARSRFNTQFPATLAEYNQAKAAGDQKRIAELKDVFHAMQDRLHRQAFGQEPVDDLLASIQDQLPAIRAKAGVEEIVQGPAPAEPGVEAVDVTDLLVAEFEPGEDTLKTIRELRKHPPLRPPYPKHWD